jgi:hypothetical protein
LQEGRSDRGERRGVRRTGIEEVETLGKERSTRELGGSSSALITEDGASDSMLAMISDFSGDDRLDGSHCTRPSRAARVAEAS